MIFYISVFFIFGASLGSFIGVLVMRQNPAKKPDYNGILYGRSHCDGCRKILKPIELIPLLSFLFQKGKCKKCGAKIPSNLFFLELFTGIIFLILAYINSQAIQNFLIFGNYSGIFDVIIELFLILIFVYLAFYDYLYWQIQKRFVLFLISTSGIILFGTYFFDLIDLSKLLDHYISGFLAFMWIVIWMCISKFKGLDWGDAYIFGLVGFVLGWEDTVVVFFVSIICGVVVGIFKAMFVDGKLKNNIIQFIPFVTLGFIVAIIEQGEILRLIFPYF